MKHHVALAALLVAAIPSMSACSQRSGAGNETASIGDTVRHETAKGLNEARDKLQTENFTLTSDHDKTKAEITPKGDLLIDGRAVAVNADQRALLLKYRGQITRMAAAGIDVGVQGADLGAKAAGEAIKGLLTGGIDENAIEAHVNQEAEKLKVSAMKLCDQMPAMLATQQDLAASLPEFRPYAKMDQSDIDDCRKDGTIKDRT